MTHADIESQTAAFFAKGGKIKEVPAGQRAEVVPGLNACRIVVLGIAIGCLIGSVVLAYWGPIV